MSLRNSLFALIAAMTLSGCAKHSAGAEPAASSAQAEVSLVQPQWQTFENSIEQPGWIKAWERAALYTKINGYVQTVNVEIGTRVRKGDLLAVLSVPELDEGLKRKEALVEQAKIDIIQADAALAVARANLDTAKSLVKESRASLKSAQAFHERWKSEYARMDKLATSLVVDKQVRDEILNQFKSAEAGVELAEAKIHSAEAGQTESRRQDRQGRRGFEGGPESPRRRPGRLPQRGSHPGIRQDQGAIRRRGRRSPRRSGAFDAAGRLRQCDE